MKSAFLRVLSLFMFGGLALLWVRRHPFRVHLSAAVFGPSLIYMISHVYPRYGCPAQGISMVIAAYFALALAGMAKGAFNRNS